MIIKARKYLIIKRCYGINREAQWCWDIIWTASARFYRLVRLAALLPVYTSYHAKEIKGNGRLVH